MVFLSRNKFLDGLWIRLYAIGKGRFLPMGNDRNAGRKRRFAPEKIQEIVEAYKKGCSISELAGRYGVSRQTMSFYVHEVACEMEA